MERAVLGRSLQGGYIEEYEFDMRRNSVSMRVDVLENDVLSRYDLEFHQVSYFSFETETRKGSAGDRLEITELWIDATPEASGSEEWELTISMWDLSHLRIRCSTIVVDGMVLR
jgi:hypothetical protein